MVYIRRSGNFKLAHGVKNGGQVTNQTTAHNQYLDRLTNIKQFYETGSNTCVLCVYLTGDAALLERFFNLQLWSYHDTPLNYNGRVALPFSLLWGGLGLVFNYYLHPRVESVLLQIPLGLKILLVTIFTIYFVIDLVHSTILLHQIDISLRFINKISGNLETPNLHSARVSFRRLISTYPKIRHTLTESVSFIQEKQAALEHLKRDSLEKIRSMKSGKCLERMVPLNFTDLTKDILEHPEFQQLANFTHHRPFSILEHSLHVAHLTFSWSCKLRFIINLDVRSATRGALLHDFYLYDWHLPRPDGSRWHGFRHPRIACQNAERCFDLNPKEKGIIYTHMWPLTVSWPSSREAFLVSFADKVATVQEFYVRIGYLLGLKSI